MLPNYYFPPASRTCITRRHALPVTAAKTTGNTTVQLSLLTLSTGYRVSMWFGMRLNSVFFCTNRVGNLVPLESVREHFVVNFPGTHFQAHEATMNLLGKLGPLDHLWTQNLENAVCFPEVKLDKTWGKLEHTRQINL
jgi:hypothetical protein